MFAYLLLAVAILTRLLPHAGWFNFTAVGGALLYFGARRPWREMLAPLAALMATDYLLTVYSYHYVFAWQGYVPTWAWYLAAMAWARFCCTAGPVCSRGCRSTAGTDFVFCPFELCCVARRKCIREPRLD